MAELKRHNLMHRSRQHWERRLFVVGLAQLQASDPNILFTYSNRMAHSLSPLNQVSNSINIGQAAKAHRQPYQRRTGSRRASIFGRVVPVSLLRMRQLQQQDGWIILSG